MVQEIAFHNSAESKICRILVADDLAITAQIARAMLEAAGHRVDVVADGEAVLHAVSNEKYDLVLMDVHMAVMDGISATRMIRLLPGAQSIVPIIAMTARTSEGDRSLLLAAGMSGHVGKPFRNAELLAAIDPWLP